ncbi:MAG: flagellar biosynthesis protein FlhB [Rhizobiales bacterium]|nr:flagellar biosynthesis protein FlhB [Hyphomicrobiales bacterium]
MAEQEDDTEKTEDPTQKKIDDAYKKGQVPKSQEVNTWFILLAGTVIVGLLTNHIATSLVNPFSLLLGNFHEIRVNGGQARSLFAHMGGAMFNALWMPLGLLIIAAFVGNMVQHRLIFTNETIKPKFSKISPLAGAKRLFSSTSLVNFAKGIVKLAVVGGVMYVIVVADADVLPLLIQMDIAALLPMIKISVVKMLAGALAVITVIAVFDYAWQRYTWFKKLKMSFKDIKDEHKQMEGDPAVKAKLRQVRLERGRRRMMASVPEASVVVTNPTHYAVALKYEPGMAAPICVAKGADATALKIREIAKENNVPVIENPPLARTLHAGVEVDQEIPAEQYKAVAQLIGVVMQLRNRQAWRSKAS